VPENTIKAVIKYLLVRPVNNNCHINWCDNEITAYQKVIGSGHFGVVPDMASCSGHIDKCEA